MIRQLLKDGKDVRKLYEGMINKLTVGSLRRHKKLIIAGALIGYQEDFENVDKGDLIEIVKDMLPGDLEIYYSDEHRSPLIVKNVKHTGGPDWDDVIKRASVKANVSENAISEYLTDEFINQWFEVRVLAVTERLANQYDDFSVAGRSGGYWGVLFETEMVKIDKRSFETEFGNYLKDNSDKIVEIYEGERQDPEELGRQLASDALESDAIDYGDIIRFDKEEEEGLKDLERDMIDVIKTSEKSDGWVDEIIENKYWV